MKKELERRDALANPAKAKTAKLTVKLLSDVVAKHQVFRLQVGNLSTQGDHARERSRGDHDCCETGRHGREFRRVMQRSWPPQTGPYQHLLLQPGRGGRAGHAHAEGGGDSFGFEDDFAAAHTFGSVERDQAFHLLFERADGELIGHFLAYVTAIVRHGYSRRSDSRAERSFCMPRRMRVLTVPSGSCSAKAISCCVRPPK